MDSRVTAREHAIADIVRRAGALALDLFRRPDELKISMKGQQDWLTLADGAVEGFVRKEIAALFPSDAVLGEEEGGEDGDELWIIDPIDGTANFARSDRVWCISVGFVLQGEPTLGVIFAPALDEFYAARKGCGATMNGKSIHAAATDRLDLAVLELGWSARLPNSVYVDALSQSLNAGVSVKRSGSGALGVAQVAIGRTDAYAEAHINSWDVAAGLVIATEAGAISNAYASGDWVKNGNPILCAQPRLFDGFSELLADLMRQKLPSDLG